VQYDGTSWVPILTFCPACNKYGADLSNQVLKGAYFPDITLSLASLTNANLNYADLTGADLYDANLTSANLESANLTHADLYGANLTGADLYGVNLTSAALYDANLTNANLFSATGGTTTDVTTVIWNNTTCPDSTNSNNDGHTCVGHGF
jgi:uncharacterized protein YjbI with pentapeptide repeats